MTGQMLTVDQVCRLVQLSPDAVRRAARRGDVRAAKLGGRLRFHPGDVDRWVAAMTIDPPDPGPAPVGSRAVAANLDAYRLTL